MDLFTGTGSVAKQLREMGYEVITLDVNQNKNPDICIDVLQWDYKKDFPKGHFRVIAAGPPCEEYSTAKTRQPRDFEKADKIVEKTIEIIKWFDPPVWWIENPRGGYLKERECIKNLPFIDVDYFQFSDWGYQNPLVFGAVRPLRVGKLFV